MELLLTEQNINEIINKTSKIIEFGGVAILPFDTVYGFVCDPKNDEALQQIYELKKCPTMKTIGLAANNIESIESIAEVNDDAKNYMVDRTSGKYTFILKKLSWIPNQVGNDREVISDFCVQNDTVGIRIPDSELILSIAEKCGGLIAQTSANISGQGNCYSITDIKRQYDDATLSKVDLIVNGGELENNGASKLINLTGETPVEIKR